MRNGAAFATCTVAAATFACSSISSSMFWGPMPEPAAPRIVLSPDRLAEIDSAADPRVSRFALHSPPYWEPSAPEIRACELSLWQSAHWDDVDEKLPDYALQFAGVTRRGSPVIIIQGFCRSHWERDGVLDELASFPARAFDMCRCHIWARCNPRTGSLTNYGNAACRR